MSYYYSKPVNEVEDDSDDWTAEFLAQCKPPSVTLPQVVDDLSLQSNDSEVFEIEPGTLSHVILNRQKVKLAVNFSKTPPKVKKPSTPPPVTKPPSPAVEEIEEEFEYLPRHRAKSQTLKQREKLLKEKELELQRQLEELRTEKERIEEHSRQEADRLREERGSYEQSLIDLEALGLSTDFLCDEDCGGDVMEFEDSEEVSRKLLRNIRAMRSELESDLFLTKENCTFDEHANMLRLDGRTAPQISYASLLDYEFE